MRPYSLHKRQSFAAYKFIEWKFNIAVAPWWGGIWERLVSSVKRCLKKTIGLRKIDFVELQTPLLEIETILNNRPLCPYYEIGRLLLLQYRNGPSLQLRSGFST